MSASGSPIIVVKRPRKHGGGHHGGAWKVAYADFVTAMMAFFMVLWLVTALNKQERAALLEYFKNPSMEEGKSTRAAPAQMGPGGASTSPINLGGGLDAPRTAQVKPIGPVETSKLMDADTAKAVADAAEHHKLQDLMDQLREAIEKSPSLEPFKNQLLLDITPEGLRIQIVDEQSRPMFDVGSARLKDYTVVILHELARYLSTVPNRISLSGHTDVRPYPGGRGYSNWELSSDRANAARRALEDGGLEAEKISRVVGLASTVLFDPADPQNPINRRISIVVMTRAAEDSARKTDAPAGGQEQAPSAASVVPAATVQAAPAAVPAATAPSARAVTAQASPAVAVKAAPAGAQTALAADPVPVL